ncbi:STAS domain-containing protein [Planosporangium sp. 12N6]|uniref:STAS domain-containing protein n=1 Tax=Planosporangium spinosum TaxID=3402278 RepID=UPI003CEE5502
MDNLVPGDQAQLRIGVEPAGHDEVIMTVGGKLGSATAHRLRTAITAVLNRGGIRAIGLDLRRLNFIDSTGVDTLVIAQRISAQVGVRLRLTAVSAVAAHLLSALGVDVMRGLRPARIETLAPGGAG